MRILFLRARKSQVQPKQDLLVARWNDGLVLGFRVWGLGLIRV